MDSSALAFQIAARGAFREAMSKCGARLLEPVMKVRKNAQEIMLSIHPRVEGGDWGGGVTTHPVHFIAKSCIICYKQVPFLISPWISGNVSVSYVAVLQPTTACTHTGRGYHT